MAGDGSGMDEAPVTITDDVPDWAPAGIDLTVPSVARSYDYALGGAHSFAVDREFFRAVEAVLPGAREMARANRAFLHRAVRYMIQQGIRQFLDVGSGIPTVGNVHEIAQRYAAESRIVYVDLDPVAVAHSRLILAGNARATAIQADARRVEEVLDHPDARALLDFDQPVGLILAAILHAVPDDAEAYGVMEALRAVAAPGSYVAISHATADSRPAEIRLAEELGKRSSTPGRGRTHAEVLAFFAGFDLVEPGLVWAPQWRPDRPEDVGPHPERLVTYAGVGRKG
jgi:hypothetical protein